MSEPTPVTEPAPAKLNLFLRVLRPRPDGYHDVESLLVPLTLADGVRAAPRDGGLRLTVAGELAAEVPSGEENLVLRAARALERRAAKGRGVHLLLVKRIPVAAGLGGGSADAAAALRALDRLWSCGLGPAGLRDVGASLGSDVPALVEGGPALVRGRGEDVQPTALPRTWFVLLPVPRGVRAADAYRWWDQDGAAPGPDPGPLVDALGRGDIERAAPLAFNDLEEPVARRRPEVGEAKRRLLEAGSLSAIMCGSGPTVAGMAADGAHAERIASEVGGTVVAGMSGPVPGKGTGR